MTDTPEIKYLFIRRPIFAAVISIVIVLLGALRAHHAADQSISPDHPAVGPGLGSVSGGHRGRRRHCGGGADRAATLRARRPAVLQVVQRQRRDDEPAGVLRPLPGPRPRGGGRPEPGQPGRAPAAPGGRAAGDHHHEGADRHPCGHRAHLEGPPLRRGLSEQLRPDLHHRRAQAHSRRGRRLAHRLAPVLDAAEPRSRPHGPARPHGVGCAGGGAGAEHHQSGGPHRPGAGAAGEPTDHSGHDPGPAHGSQGVRRHHRPRQPRWLAGPGQGHRPGDARVPELRPGRPGERRSYRRHPAVPPAGRERAQREAGGRGADERAGPELPGGGDLVHPLRYHAVHHGLDRRGGEDPVRSHAPGDPGGLHLPAELAHDPDPGARRAGRDHRHLLRAA